MTSGEFQAEPLDLQVTLSDDRLQVVRNQDRIPLDLMLDHDLSSGRSELTFAAAGLNLADLLRFDQQHSVFSLLPGATVSGSARWAHDPDLGMAYEAKISGHLSAGTDTPPAAVALVARGDDARVEVSKLTVETAEGGLDFSGDMLLDTLVPQGELAIRSLQVRTGEKLNAQVSLTRGEDGAMALRSRRLELDETAFRRFDLDLRPATACAADLPLPGPRRGAAGVRQFHRRRGTDRSLGGPAAGAGRHFRGSRRRHPAAARRGRRESSSRGPPEASMQCS